MGDNYGNVGINAGYARFNALDYGKVGAEGTYKGEFNNPDIGYALSANANALIGNKNGFNGGVYAGLDFGKTTCSEFNLGVMADYTAAFAKNNVINVQNGDLTSIEADLDPKKSLKTGLSLGFTRNICCDEGRKLKMALTGGAEFHPEPTLDLESGQVINNKNLKKVSPFIGSNVEYSKQINDKGQQIVFGAKCALSKTGTTYGEASIGFRF